MANCPRTLSALVDEAPPRPSCGAALNGTTSPELASGTKVPFVGGQPEAIGGRPTAVAASSSQSAPHMHVLVCVCSDVRQFDHDVVL